VVIDVVGHRADRVDEAQGGAEVGEAEGLAQPAAARVPAVELAEEGGDRVRRERRRALGDGTDGPIRELHHISLPCDVSACRHLGLHRRGGAFIT
jgi:hypothetical protein